MKLAKSIEEVHAAVRTARENRLVIGLVPTMGALHAGHASLIRAAGKDTNFVVVTIFVNPTQFGPHEDFQDYPRSLEADLKVCKSEQVDLVFTPPVEEIYPPGFCSHVEVAGLQDVLCGPSRPGHFRGVATVVLKLFNIVQPDVAYFGQKDAQQARIIQQLVRDLNVPITIRVCPTVREADGLALSSRNGYLTPEQRQRAPALYRALQTAEKLVAGGERDANAVRQAMRGVIQAVPGAVIDYVELVDHDTLRPVTQIDREVLAALAVTFGKTRLIDNTLLRGV